MTHHEPGWETYARQLLDGRIDVSFDTRAHRIDRNIYSHGARVMIPLREPTLAGRLTLAEHDRLDHLQQSLQAHLVRRAAPAVLVARVTQLNLHELVFQINVSNRFELAVAQWTTQQVGSQIIVHAYRGWDYFDDLIWPSDRMWLAIHDRNRIGRLTSMGADPNQTHLLLYGFRGQALQLARARRKLKERGYGELRIGNRVLELTERSEVLLMVKQSTLELSLIYQESLRNARFAQDNGISYDGWKLLERQIQRAQPSRRLLTA